MFFEQDSLENKIKRLEERLSRLEKENELLDQAGDALHSEMGVTSKQVSVLLSDAKYFSKSDWEQLEQLRRIRDQKLESELSGVKDLAKTKKTYKDRNVPTHWMFVR
jgi:hypothetical protein